jgi:hypothetical protein
VIAPCRPANHQVRIHMQSSLAQGAREKQQRITMLRVCRMNRAKGCGRKIKEECHMLQLASKTMIPQTIIHLIQAMRTLVRFNDKSTPPIEKKDRGYHIIATGIFAPAHGCKISTHMMLRASTTNPVPRHTKNFCKTKASPCKLAGACIYIFPTQNSGRANPFLRLFGFEFT